MWLIFLVICPKSFKIFETLPDCVNRLLVDSDQMLEHLSTQCELRNLLHYK